MVILATESGIDSKAAACFVTAYRHQPFTSRSLEMKKPAMLRLLPWIMLNSCVDFPNFGHAQ